MEGKILDHISEGALEEYSLDRLPESTCAQVEEHLLLCEGCRARLVGIEPVHFVHITDEGPVYSRGTRLMTGEVMARHWGHNLDGGRRFGSVLAAREYLYNSFAEMFPEHRCDGRCGALQNRGLTVVPRPLQIPKT